MSTLTLTPAAAALALTGGTPSLTLILSPAAAQIRLGGSTPGVSIVRTTASGSGVYIGSTRFLWRASTFRLTKTDSGEWSADFELNFFGGFTPGDLVDREVALFWNSVKRFGGLVQSVEEVGSPGNSAASGVPFSILKIKCTGFSAYFDRVVYAKLVTIPLGTITGEMVYNFWYEKLAQFGVSKVGDSPNTSVPEQLFHYITGSEVLSRIKEQDPGYGYWIDDYKELKYQDVSAGGGVAAPFSVVDGDRNCDFLSVITSNTKFRNRQYVLPSADLQALRDDSQTAVAGQTGFSTSYTLPSLPTVKVDGVEQTVVVFGDFTPGWQFYYVPGGVGVFAASAPGAGAVVEIFYPSPFPVAEVAEDAASIAAVGPYEAIWQAKNVYDRATAQAIAQGFIDLYCTGGYQQELVLQYNSYDQPAWLLPGDVVTFNKSFPTAVGDFVVEQIAAQEMKLAVWKFTVKLRSGLGEVTEAQALLQNKISARVPIDSPPYQLPWSLFEDVNGLTNPGAITGAVKLAHTVQTAGVLNSWQIIAGDDPPSGDDFIMDVLVNGASVLPVADADKVFAADGVTTLQQGTKFLTDNIPVSAGDIVTLNVLQVGSDYGGANFTFYLNIKVTGNVGKA